MVKQALKQLKKIVFAWIVGLTSIFIPLLILCIKTLYKGKSVWTAKPRSVPPKCLNASELGSHHFIKLKNIKLHYVEAGDKSKPLVLFLHGFPEFWYSWRYQIKAMKKKFWTVAVDMRGYGDSDKPSGSDAYDDSRLVDDMKDLVHALGRSSCVLIAHDWGGVVAYLMAKRYPKLIDQMIILNSPHPLALFVLRSTSWKQFLKSWYMYFFQIPYLPEFFLMTQDIVIFDQIFNDKKFKATKSVSDEDIEAFKYTFSSGDKWSGPLNYYRRLYLKQHIIEKEMDVKITVPTMIIWGCNDLALETKLAELSAGYFTNCKVNYIEDGGHFIQQDSPTAVNQYIENFLKQK